MSWRTDDELLTRVRNSAEASGLSLNAYVTRILTIATSEDESDSEAMRLRQRLRIAGLLAESHALTHSRPKDSDIETAAQHAGEGTPVSDLIDHMRS